MKGIGMSDDENVQMIDDARSAHLCDVGAEWLLAAVTIGADGREHIALVHRELLGDDNAGYDPGCTAVQHEQLGPLPAAWRSRIAHAVNRCGRPTTTGAPCRIGVTRPGHPCHWHNNRKADTA